MERLIAYYRAGTTVYTLGSQFGIDRRTVGAILKRHGVQTRWQRLSPARIDEAVELYESGWSLARIAERVGVTPTTVHRRLRDRGVRMRDTRGRTQESEEDVVPERAAVMPARPVGTVGAVPYA